VVEKSRLTNCFGEVVSELLTGEKIPRNKHAGRSRASCIKRLEIQARGDSFHDMFREFRRKSGIEILKLLSQEACTHYLDITTHSSYGDDRYINAYSVLRFHSEEIIAAIDRFRQWCLDDVDIDNDEIEGAFYTLNTAEAFGDEPVCGDFLFLFSVLKTIADLLRFARHRELYWDGEFWVVYCSCLDMGLQREEIEELMKSPMIRGHGELVDPNSDQVEWSM
jgi:hypothetical protein